MACEISPDIQDTELKSISVSHSSAKFWSWLKKSMRSKSSRLRLNAQSLPLNVSRVMVHAFRVKTYKTMDPKVRRIRWPIVQGYSTTWVLGGSEEGGNTVESLVATKNERQSLLPICFFCKWLKSWYCTKTPLLKNCFPTKKKMLFITIQNNF